MEKKNKSDIYENIEYIAVYKNKQQLEVIDGKDINGKTKTYLQKYLGNKYGAGTYRLSIKLINESKNIVGSIAGIVTNKTEDKEDNKLDLILNILQQMINNNEQKNNYNLDTLLQIKDQAINMQIEFYRERIKVLEEENKKLKEELNNQDNSDILSTLLPLLIKKEQ